MWDRALLKQNAKTAFKRNYWWAVLWAIVYVFLTVSGSSSGHSGSDSDFAGLSYSAGIALGAVIGGLSLLMVAVRIVIGSPFRIGYSRWLLNCSEGTPQTSDIGFFFRGKQLGRSIAGIFVTDLIIALWTLLLIVPGIVAGYKYKLVPYLMAENPEMAGREARQRSAELMNGYKMDAFILDLSFIGWFLLGCVTFGILLVFYVEPYYYATMCEFYRAVRDCSRVNAWSTNGYQTGEAWNQYNGQSGNAQNQYYGQPGQEADRQNPYSQSSGMQNPYYGPTSRNISSQDAPDQNSQNAAPTEAVRYCPGCGSKIVGPARFCNNCGAKL